MVRSPKDKPLEKVADMSYYQWHLHQLVDGQMEPKQQKECQGIDPDRLWGPACSSIK